MKKLILLTLIVLGTVSFARGGSDRGLDDPSIGDSLRDYEYNEKRDIVDPMEESVERMSRFSPYELELEVIAAEKNIEKYDKFHQELIMEELGDNNDDRRDREF